MQKINYSLWCFTELYYDRGNHHEFTSLVKELARPGELTHNQSYPFEFQQVEKPYESYTGANVRLRSVHFALSLTVMCITVHFFFFFFFEVSNLTALYSAQRCVSCC